MVAFRRRGDHSLPQAACHHSAKPQPFPNIRLHEPKAAVAHRHGARLTWRQPDSYAFLYFALLEFGATIHVVTSRRHCDRRRTLAARAA
eukprot:4765907-Prymnesium_polylepis.1